MYQARGRFEVYRRIKARQPRASVNLLYALIGAVESRDGCVVAHTGRASVLPRLEQMGLPGRGGPGGPAAQGDRISA